MEDGFDFLQLLELQDGLELVTKSELLEKAKKKGASVSVRQLTSYVSEGLIPKSARIGSRGGAYPQLVVKQLLFVDRFRRRGLSVQAIRELLPLWRYMQRARRDREVSLKEIQDVARDSITAHEAWFAVPSVLQESLPCPLCKNPGISDIKFRMMDGSLKISSSADPVSIGFAIAEMNEETGNARVVTSMRIAIPCEDEGFNDSSIVLGVPKDVAVEPALDHGDSPLDQGLSASVTEAANRIEGGEG